jgi:hypothetical protein
MTDETQTDETSSTDTVPLPTVAPAEPDAETLARVEELAAALVPTRPPLVDPEEDEVSDDLVFVKNGWLRVTVNGSQCKLRRPFLGELRDLELSRETDVEALQVRQREMRLTTDALLERARAIEVEARALNGEHPERKQALDLEATELGLTAQKESRKLIREAQDLRAKWWEQVFKTLTPPGHAKPNKNHYPAWVGDATVQQRVIEHWQASPLARGGG